MRKTIQYFFKLSTVLKHQIFTLIALNYKQTKTLYCDLQFAILFVMFPLAVTLQTYYKSCFLEAEIGWQACIYYMFLTFCLLSLICYSKNIFLTVKIDMNEYLIVPAFTLHLYLHVSLDIYIYLLHTKELKGWHLG